MRQNMIFYAQALEVDYIDDPSFVVREAGPMNLSLVEAYCE